MVSIKSKSCTFSEGDQVVTLEYTLHQCELDGIHRYGISVSKLSDGDHASVQDITSDYSLALEYFLRLVEAKVTPVTLLDVIFDFVAE